MFRNHNKRVLSQRDQDLDPVDDEMPCLHKDLEYIEEEEVFTCKDCEEDLTPSEAFQAWQKLREVHQ